MVEKNNTENHLIRARDVEKQKPVVISQPFNPKSEVQYIPLSEQAGMTRAHLAMGRVAPGKESFIPHAHSQQEEFLYILSGSGTAIIGGEEYKVGPGDYMGFPCDGVPHNLANTGKVDLVYLMGGERTDVEVVKFPTLDRTMVMKEGKYFVADDKTLQELSRADWVKDK